ncbi:MAG: hypothetical protein ABSA30_07505, partial [Candidatus Aminicenantales bacterium]
MVLGNVEHGGDVDLEALDVFKLEAADFYDVEVVRTAVADEGQQGHADVAGQEGPPSALDQDLVGQGGGRRFPVCPGDADQGPLEEPVGQLDLGQDGHTRLPGRLDFGQLGNARAGHDQIGGQECRRVVAAAFDGRAAVRPGGQLR